jgi:hypothetical protein
MTLAGYESNVTPQVTLIDWKTKKKFANSKG